MSIAIPTPPPTLENYFNLEIGDEETWVTCNPGTDEEARANTSMQKITIWTNPHLGLAITPYVPMDSLNFAPSTSSTFSNDLSSMFFNCRDVMVVVLSSLDLKNVINCSTVCKSFHTAVKSDSTWRVQLCQFLPNVTFIAPPLCSFIPQQQFSIIFKRIESECKPYIAKFDRTQKLCIYALKQLKTLELQFEEAGGMEAADRHSQGLTRILMQHANNPQANPEEVNQEIIAFGKDSSDSVASQLRFKINRFKYDLEQLSGANYDGTIESIDSNSIQGQIMKAIQMLVPNAFDNQEKFEEEIRKAETAKNNSSSNSDGPIIEDVTDVSEPT